MLIAKLPKAFRTAIFMLGLGMITMASAIEQIEDWSETARLAECPADTVASTILTVFRR